MNAKQISKSEAVRQIKAMPGMTARLRDGEIRLNRKGHPEVEAYYTTDAQDAVDTAAYMVKNPVQTPQI